MFVERGLSGLLNLPQMAKLTSSTKGAADSLPPTSARGLRAYAGPVKRPVHPD